MPDFLLDVARAGHLAGLAFGLGLAICADLVALSTTFRSIQSRDVWLLTRLHQLIIGGLAILWLTGAIILFARTGFDPGQFTPKLMMKIIVVLLLTGNAILIGQFGLPAIARHVGHSFGMFPQKERFLLAAMAGLSAACWSSALALGVFRHLKVMSLPDLLSLFGPVFIGSFLVAALFAKAAFRFSGMPGRRDWPAAEAH